MLTQKFWQKYFKAYDTLNLALPYQELLNKIIDFLQIKKGDLVFDAGSGTGNLSLKIKQSGGIAIGLDFSKEGIKIHKTKDRNAQVILGDLTKSLPFKNQYFDKIATNNVIYTLNRAARLGIFKEFYRVLKPGGIIVVSNLRVGFKPVKILRDHLSLSYKKTGLLNTLTDIIGLSLSVVKIFYYNFLIKKENKAGSYSFVDIGEQKKILLKSGFKPVVSDVLIYSKQAILDVAKKT